MNRHDPEMVTVTLKKIPPELLRELKNRALAHHRSLNQEVIATLQAVTATTYRLDTQAIVRSHWSAAVEAHHRRNGNRERALARRDHNDIPVGHTDNGSQPLERDDAS
jgi:plasmid stability protein